jgi:hypothetical protein
MLVVLHTILHNNINQVQSAPILSGLISDIKYYKDGCKINDDCASDEKCGFAEYYQYDYESFTSAYNSTLRFKMCIKKSNCDR